MSIDHIGDAQRAAEQRLEQCYEALYQEEDGSTEGDWPEGLMAPFCGCSTCEVREVLNAAYPHLRLDFLAEVEVVE